MMVYKQETDSLHAMRATSILLYTDVIWFWQEISLDYMCLAMSTMAKRYPEDKRGGFYQIRMWITLHCNAQSLLQHSETAVSPVDKVNSMLRKHFGSKKPPNGIKCSACRWWRYSSAVHLLKAGTDVQWFLFRVTVGTEANQLTVNKWSPSFYRAGERKPECHSTPSGCHTHSGSHTCH